MAKIRDYAITINTVATASLVCEMPVHATGDVLLAFLNKDSTTGFAGTGWNALQAQNSAGAHGAVWTKRATSSSETITFTLTLETCLAVVVAVKNAEAEINSGLITINCNSAGTYTRTAGSFTTDGFEPGQSVLFSGNTSAGNNVIKIISTITGAGTIITVTDATGMVTESGNGDERAVSTGVDVTAVTGADDLTFPLAGATMTPIDNNCLLFDWLSTDIGIGPSALPGWVNIFTGDAGANSGCLSYTYQKTAASVTHSGHWGGVTSTAADSRAFMIAIRDNGSETEVDPYVDRATVGSAVVSSIVGVTGEIDAGTWATTALSLATVGAKSTTFDAIATVADSGYIPFWGSASFTPATSTTNLVGSELGLTTATDMQTGSPLLFGTWNFLTPRDYVDLGKASTGGLIIAVADSTNDYKAWTIGGQFDKTTNPDKRNKFAIQVNQTTSTTYGASGTLNNVNKVLYLAAGVYGAVAWRGSNLWLLTETILAGGSATIPLTFEQMEIAINDGTGRIPIFDRDGSAATIWTRLRVGGGDPVHYDVDAKTFQWPRAADAVDYFTFHVDANAVGIEFFGQASDTLRFTNSVFVSSSTYYWRFNASHSASATLDFSGTRVINATVTLRSTSDLNGVSFQECPTFTQNSATLTNCDFLDTKVTSAAPADAALISNSTFTSSGTGHGIEIGGTAANITLTGLTFTGYATTDGSTGNEAIYVNATGSMIISISGGSIPSIRTAGATVTVQNAVTVKVTAKDANTLAAIDAARVLMEANSVATGTHTGANGASTLTDSSKSFTTNELVNYRIYNTIDGSDGLITANDATTVTATLSGGTDNDWDTSDAYIIVAKPALNPVSITRSGTIATVTHRNHGLANDATVAIRGATQDEYNGTYTISNVSANAYDYTVSGSPTTPATGSPTSAAVILNDVTNASGVLQTTAFNYTINQPVTGKVRRAASGTKYKTGAIAGTITSAGLDTTILLIADE